MELPKNATLTGYADDVVVLILDKDVEKAQSTLTLVMRRISLWMENHSLSLALQKSEVTILTTSRIDTLVLVKIDTETIQSQSATKYLGIRIDTKLSF